MALNKISGIIIKLLIFYLTYHRQGFKSFSFQTLSPPFYHCYVFPMTESLFRITLLANFFFILIFHTAKASSIGLDVGDRVGNFSTMNGPFKWALCQGALS